LDSHSSRCIPRFVTWCHLQGFEGDLKLNATETGLENAMIKAATRDGIVQIYPLVVVYIANYGTYGTIFKGKSTFMGLVS
jgi:hypothetical protein